MTSILRFALLVAGYSAFAEIIPPDRFLGFTNAMPGVAGGIPNRTTIYTNIVDAGADNTGITDAKGIIQAAITACPSNQIVYMPAGTYLLSGRLDLKSGVSLRGAGIENTRLVLSNGTYSDGIYLAKSGTESIYYPNNDPVQSNDVVSISGRFGTNIVLGPGTYLSGFTNGRIVLVDQLNDASIYNEGGIDGDDYMGRLDASRMFRQMAEIVAVSAATNLTVYPPLSWNYTNLPQVVYFPAVFTWAGLEDFTITNACETNLTGSLIKFEQTVDCWIKNVGSHGGYTENIVLSYGLRCTITGCDIRYSAEYRYSGRGYGLHIRYASTQNELSDNVLYRTRSGVIADSTGPYNVMAYNFNAGGFNGAAGIIHTFGLSHGGNPAWNLWEGNVGSGIVADDFHGGSAYNVVFRNYLKGWAPNATATSTNYYQRAVNFWDGSIYHSVVGNVLGSPDVGSGNSYTNRFVYMDTNNSVASVEQPVIYRFGYESVGVGGTYHSEPFDTALLHGNWDWATTNVVWDPGIADHDVPNSLYLDSKPVWFGSLAWPPIGPDGSTNPIPAQQRFFDIPYLGRSATAVTVNVGTLIITP